MRARTQRSSYRGRYCTSVLLGTRSRHFDSKTPPEIYMQIVDWPSIEGLNLNIATLWHVCNQVVIVIVPNVNANQVIMNVNRSTYVKSSSKVLNFTKDFRNLVITISSKKDATPKSFAQELTWIDTVNVPLLHTLE